MFSTYQSKTLQNMLLVVNTTDVNVKGQRVALFLHTLGG